MIKKKTLNCVDKIKSGRKLENKYGWKFKKLTNTPSKIKLIKLREKLKYKLW